MGNNKSSLKSTIAVSLTNYLDAGAIVAGASGLSLWQNYLGLTEGHLGFLNAISANCLGAAIGAIIGGFLADKYGRKAIYTYNMLIYMIGVLLVVFTVNFPMLLAGFLVTGISVGVGVLTRSRYGVRGVPAAGDLLGRRVPGDKVGAPGPVARRTRG